MAKPDLDDGYLRLAHELFAALAMAGFNKWEWVVINEVLDQLYGPRKAPTALVYPTRIAARVGTYKESIVRALRTLVDAGVLVRRKEGEVAFVKDYERWTRDGKPRLGPGEIECCRRRKRRLTSVDPGNNGAPNHQSDPLNAGTTALPAIAVASTIVGNKFVPNGNTGAPGREHGRSRESRPPQTPYRRSRAEE